MRCYFSLLFSLFLVVLVLYAVNLDVSGSFKDLLEYVKIWRNQRAQDNVNSN